MKLNFWQWIGIILVVIAAIYIIRREFFTPSASSPSAPAQPTTQSM